MFCRNCGNQLKKSDLFCYKCGTNVNDVSQEQQEKEETKTKDTVKTPASSTQKNETNKKSKYIKIISCLTIISIIIGIPLVFWGPDRYGYVDYKGNEVIPIKYTNVTKFSEEIAIVAKSNKQGAINTKGAEIIPFEYDYIKDFSDGFAIATINKKCGVIDKSNNIIIPFEYDSIENFSDGFAIAKVNEKCGVIDKSNNIIIPFEYDSVKKFFDGFAIVEKNKKNALINTKNEIVVPYDYNVTDYYNGFVKVTSNKLQGIIDTNCNVIIPTVYDSLVIISNKLIKFSKSSNQGFMDINEKILFSSENESDYYSKFSNGLCQVKNKNKKFGYINEDGKSVIPCIYESASYFSNQMALVNKDGVYRLIDTNGQYIKSLKLPSSANSIFYNVFSKDWVKVGAKAPDSKDDQISYSDYNGNLLIPFSKNYNVEDIIEDSKLAFINRDGYSEIINFNGNTIISCKNKDKKITAIANNTIFKVNMENNTMTTYAYYNSNGNKILSEYDDISDAGNNLLIAKKYGIFSKIDKLKSKFFY